MNKYALIFLLLFLPVWMIGQNVQKYALVEHFTNTYCSICASKNPAFNALLNANPEGVHHISWHPSVPYPACLLYQANPTENNSRKTYYNVLGTPKLFINGQSIPGSTPLLNQSTLDSYTSQSSPLEVIVEEATISPPFGTAITLKSHAAPPTGDIRLFVSLVEKYLYFAGPNGETDHHNVFRKYLTPVDGTSVTLPAAGTEMTYSFPFDLDPSWNAAEMYVLAFVQDYSSKEVINSGTRFDPAISTGISNDLAASGIRIFPNPASESLFLDLNEAKEIPRQIRLLDLKGTVVFSVRPSALETLRISVQNLPAGIYLFEVESGERILREKIVILK
jgi:hypothetical protein